MAVGFRAVSFRCVLLFRSTAFKAYVTSRIRFAHTSMSQNPLPKTTHNGTVAHHRRRRRYHPTIKHLLQSTPKHPPALARIP